MRGCNLLERGTDLKGIFSYLLLLLLLAAFT